LLAFEFRRLNHALRDFVAKFGQFWGLGETASGRDGKERKLNP
jgi:hypothetical protein